MSDAAKHVDELLLIAYAGNPSEVRDPRVAAHINRCEQCTAQVAEFRDFANELRDDGTWWAMGPGAALAAALEEFDHQCAIEDAEAEEMLRPVLESQYSFIRAAVLHKKMFHTGGVVRLLCAESHRQLGNEPRFALVLAEHACFIADGLPNDHYPADAIYGLRGNAWKDYAVACRYLNMIDEGFEALRTAAGAYRKVVDPAVSLAIVTLCRAMLFFEQERYPEALQEIRSAAKTFQQRNETSRLFQAKEIEAAILHMMGDFTTARTMYEEGLRVANGSGDPDMKARATRNVGIAYRNAGDLSGASTYFLLSLQLYEALGSRAMVVYSHWSIATLSLAAGNTGDAAERLPAIIRDLDALGIAGDARRAQLDHVEALLILGNFEDVEAVCTRLFEFFSRAQMKTGAMMAAAYLKEAAAARRLTRRDIETVRKYLSEVERKPDLIFAPPPPGE